MAQSGDKKLPSRLNEGSPIAVLAVKPFQERLNFLSFTQNAVDLRATDRADTLRHTATRF
jgi:hypothetical protein